MRDFIIELNELYATSCKESECPPESKMAFIGSAIFEFTTYDDNADEILAERMIDVLRVILNDKIHEYVSWNENYINYLIMVNMPFLMSKIDWGTSIRGAWLNDYAEYKIANDKIIIEEGELSEFIKQLIVWSEL